MVPKDKVYQAVIDALTQIQNISGRPMRELDGEMCPIGALAGFESINAMEAVVLISTILEVNIKPQIGLFVDGRNPRTINNIVDCIYQHVKS